MGIRRGRKKWSGGKPAAPILALFAAACAQPSVQGPAPRAPAPPTEPPADRAGTEPEARPQRRGPDPWAGAKPGCRGTTGRTVSIVFGLNLQKLRRSFIWTSAAGADTLKNLTRYPVYRLLLAHCRVDLLKHTRSLSVGATSFTFAGATPDVVAALLEGSFDPVRLMACLKRTLPKNVGSATPIHVSGRRALEVRSQASNPFCLVAVGANTLAVARPAHARPTVSGEPHFGNPRLARSLKKANRQALAWGAFAGSLVGRSYPSAAATPFGVLARTEWGTFQADEMSNGNWVAKLRITTRTPRDAKLLLQLIQPFRQSAARAAGGASTKKTSVPSPSLWRNIAVKASGPDFEATLKLPGVVVRTMLYPGKATQGP